MGRMNWERAAQRDHVRETPPWKRDNIADDKVVPKKKQKKRHWRQKPVPPVCQTIMCMTPALPGTDACARHTRKEPRDA